MASLPKCTSMHFHRSFSWFNAQEWEKNIFSFQINKMICLSHLTTPPHPTFTHDPRYVQCDQNWQISPIWQNL